MNNSYTPDTTRTSLAIIATMAAAVIILALLIGLSDKPDVQAVGIVVDDLGATGSMTEAETLQARVAGADEAAAGDATGIETGQEQIIDPTTGEQSDLAADTVTATPIPTLEPTPTAEIAAAVPADPTVVAEADPDLADTDLADDMASLVGASSVDEPLVGTFFTRPDEEAGAIVTTNEVVLILGEDGTGSFTGLLDMVLPDETHIVIDMSGPITWDTLSEPQARGQLTGTYEFDSTIDADDISSTDADLSITSLSSSSGALCTPRCYGFSFPTPLG